MLEAHRFFDRHNHRQNRNTHSHFVTSVNIPSLSPNSSFHTPGIKTKIALDENTSLTGRSRSRDPRFRVAYNPETISSMVLESLDGLFGDPYRSTRNSGWSKKISSLFQSIWRSKPSTTSTPTPENGNSHSSDLEQQSSLNPTDWVLLQLFHSVCGDSPESCTIKWYTTLISNAKSTEESPNSRLVLVAFCFDKNGTVVRISGITSSKSSFHVFGY